MIFLNRFDSFVFFASAVEIFLSFEKGLNMISIFNAKKQVFFSCAYYPVPDRLGFHPFWPCLLCFGISEDFGKSLKETLAFMNRLK
jgi:hypothetical protein